MRDTALPETTQWLIAVRDNRDRSAYARLFTYFAPRLKAMLIRGGLRDGRAEDVVQDVMLTVWHKAVQFDPERADASAWIYRIARNRHIDVVRKTQTFDADPVLIGEETEPDADRIVGMAQEHDRLRDAVKTLTPDQRSILERAYFEEMSHTEISAATGLPLGTIKSRIRLGLARLRRDLTDLRKP